MRRFGIVFALVSVLIAVGLLAVRPQTASEVPQERPDLQAREPGRVPGFPGGTNPAWEGPRIISGGETTDFEDAPEANGEPPYFKYVDESGSLRIVQGWEQVPAAYRERAEPLAAGGRGVVNRMESRSRPQVRQPRSNWQPEFNPNRFDVLMYSADYCGACRKTKTFLDKRGVRYEVRDIQKDPKAKQEVRKILGKVSVPLTFINGSYVHGYMPKELDKLLKR